MACPTPIGRRPAFIPAPLVAQLTARYTWAGQPCENVYHFLGSSEWTPTTLGALATYFENWDTANNVPLRSTSSILIEVSVIALVTVDGAFIESSVSIAGSEASESLPNNCTLAIKWETDKRGRSFRGRTYHIGLTEGMQSPSDSNQVRPAQVTNLINSYGLLLHGAVPNGGQMVVLSFQNNCEWRSSGLATPITKVLVTDPFIDSQRRRLPAHNIHR